MTGEPIGRRKAPFLSWQWLSQCKAGDFCFLHPSQLPFPTIKVFSFPCHQETCRWLPGHRLLITILCQSWINSSLLRNLWNLFVLCHHCGCPYMNQRKAPKDLGFVSHRCGTQNWLPCPFSSTDFGVWRYVFVPDSSSYTNVSEALQALFKISLKVSSCWLKLFLPMSTHLTPWPDFEIVLF